MSVNENEGSVYLPAMGGLSISPHIRIERETSVGQAVIRTLVEINPEPGADTVALVEAVGRVVKDLHDAETDERVG